MLRYSRAADGGAVFRRVAAREDTEASDAHYAFWNPFSLHFSTRSTETRYQNDTYPTFLDQDTLTHFIGCFPGPFFVYNLRKVLPTWFAILWLFLSLVFAPFNIYISCHRDVYRRVRSFVVVLIRFVIPFCFLGFGVYDTPPPPKLFAIVMTICTKSPVSNMLFSSMNLRVMFSQHAILHSVALTVALLWIPGFCQNCSSEPNLTNKFNEMGYGIDWLFSKGFLNRLPEPTSYPCWMIAALVIVVFGYIIPTLIVFLSEVSSRAVFLQLRVSEEYQQSLRKFKQHAIKVGWMGCIFSIVATWFLLSLIRDSTLGEPSSPST